MRILLIQAVILVALYFGLKDHLVIRYKTIGKQTTLKKFRMPVIKNFYQGKEGVKLAKTDVMLPTYSRFVGKYKFADSINLDKDKLEGGYVGNRHLIREMADTIDVNSFEFRTDYEQDVYVNRFDNELYAYYPVYFINTSQSDKLFMEASGIHEALKSDHRWYWQPIEFASPGGSESVPVIVKPGEFVVVLMRKYKGSFKTKLRVRFRMGASIYISKSFPGMISRGQFKLKNKEVITDLQDGYRHLVWKWFYGANLEDDQWKTYR